MRQHTKIILLTIAYAFYSVVPLTVLAANTISEVVPLSFGALEIPRSSKDITIDPAGGAPSGSGTIINDTTSRGQYLITGSNNGNQTITIDIQNISDGSSALTLSNFKGRYNNQAINSFPKSNLVNPGQSGKTLYLGAKLQYTSAVQERSYTMTYDIVVTFP